MRGRKSGCGKHDGSAWRVLAGNRSYKTYRTYGEATNQRRATENEPPRTRNQEPGTKN